MYITFQIAFTMPQLHYLEVNCEQTFEFFNTSVLEYVRLMFYFLYHDTTNPHLAHFDNVFYGFMEYYDQYGLLPTAGLPARTDRSTVDFTNRQDVHKSVFATSANAKENTEFDDSLKELKLPDTPLFNYDGIHTDGYILLSRRQTVTQALRTVAGEVIRSATLLVLECDELHKEHKNDMALNISNRLKNLIVQVNGMECSRKLYYKEPQRGDTNDLSIKIDHSDTAWFDYMEFYLFYMGLGGAPGGETTAYTPTLQTLFADFETDLLPVFDELKDRIGKTPKPYYCTQHYLMYWSHLILTHRASTHPKVRALKLYCRSFNTALVLNGIVEKQSKILQNDRIYWNKKIGNFLPKEKRRTAYWVQNRQLRWDGKMLYVYSHSTRQPWRVSHKADPESKQVQLYYILYIYIYILIHIFHICIFIYIYIYIYVCIHMYI